MKRFIFILTVLILFSFLIMPLLMPNCGKDGVYVGWGPSDQCPMSSSAMMWEHISEMSKMLLGTLVNIFLVLPILVFVYWTRVDYDLIGSSDPPRISFRVNSQGINSYYYLMKPFDDLLFILTKLHKKHLIAL